MPASQPGLSGGLALVVTAALLDAGIASLARASWTESPYVNLPVSVGSFTQDEPEVISDGAGGAIITFVKEGGTSGADIYARRILSDGTLDPTWPSSGLVVCSASGGQTYPKLVPDGSGGAIVAWLDHRGLTTDQDIYAQHVLANGQCDPIWPVNGRAICVAPKRQVDPAIVSDGAGGAWLTWSDYRFGTYSDVYYQHVIASGQIAPNIVANGAPLCDDVGYQEQPGAVSDGAGGAIFTWTDGRTFAYDVYAQHVLASGATDPAWPVNGSAVCALAGNQESQRIVEDGAGGAIIAWIDYRGGPNKQIFASRVLASAGVDLSWPANGLQVVSGFGQYGRMEASPDGFGGILVCWEGSDPAGMFMKRVSAEGALDPAWPSEGARPATYPAAANFPQLVPDGTGGALVCWMDHRNGDYYDIYAQHVLGSGIVDPSWPISGRPICLAPYEQYNPRLALTLDGGVVICWGDERNGVDADVYAQHVSSRGALGVGAELAGEHQSPELSPPWPNPGSRKLTIPFSLASPAHVRIGVYDAAGRMTRELVDQRLAPGRHSTTWDLADEGGRSASAGLYFVRLDAGAAHAVRRVAVIR